MDKLHDERHRERERLYRAFEDLGGLPRQRAIGLRGAVLMWRLVDALQYVPSEDRFRLLSSPDSRYMFHVLARSLRDML